MALLSSSSNKKTLGPKASFSLVKFEPLSDWKKIMYLGLVLFALIVIWSGYLFWNIQSDSGLDVSPDTATVRKAQTMAKNLKMVSEIYTQKGNTFESLLTNIPVVVDPSK